MKAKTLDSIMKRMQDALRIDFGKDILFTGSIDRSINTGKTPRFKVYLNSGKIESAFMSSITGDWYFSNPIEIDRAACETIRHYKTLYRVNRDAKFNIKTSVLKESYDHLAESIKKTIEGENQHLHVTEVEFVDEVVENKTSQIPTPVGRYTSDDFANGTVEDAFSF